MKTVFDTIRKTNCLLLHKTLTFLTRHISIGQKMNFIKQNNIKLSFYDKRFFVRVLIKF